MKRGMIPHFVLFAAAFAELTGTPCTQVTKENACFPPAKVRWSSTTGDHAVGDNVTMFCKVNVGNAKLANSTEVEWSVQPHRSLQKNVSLQHQVSNDGKTTNTSLTLRNVTKNDTGLYTITFCNMCGSVSCQTSLKVRDACFYKRPDPVQKEVTINVSQDVSTLKLAANFTGTTDQTQWLVIWSNSSTSGLGFLRGKYRTNHRDVSHCLFTAELIIHNVSINDAGLYFAKVYDSKDTGVNTTFYVNIMNHEGHKKKEYYAFVALVSVGILPAVGVIGLIWYLRLHHKQNRRHSDSQWSLRIGGARGRLSARQPMQLIGGARPPKANIGEATGPPGPTLSYSHDPPISSEVEEEQEEELDCAFHTTNPQLAAQHCPHGHHSTFFLYCKADVSEESLYNLADILAKHGISSCLDITADPIPANWSIWTEEKIESCDYVILVCTAPLYKALKDNIKCTDMNLVEMFQGKFFSCAVVNFVRAPKFIPVFIDSTPDKNVVPAQLRTHHFFHLRLTELMQAEKGKPREYVEKEINNNPLFRDIKQLIDLLQ